MIEYYYYTLSLFVCFFYYSKKQFHALTPAEANYILQQKVLVDQNKRDFLSNEFRLNNFFTLKSSFGDTKKISTPEQLYSLSFDGERSKTDYKPRTCFNRQQLDYIVSLAN